MAEATLAHRAREAWKRYRVIVYLLAGLLAVDAVVASCRGIWCAQDPDDYRERLDGCQRAAHDLVLIGGSPVSEGIDPTCLAGLSWRDAVLGSVYNLGLPGATTAEIWHAVEHGLAAPPRLLVYGITASDLNDARQEPHGPRSLMSLRDVGTWVRYRPRSAEWCIRQVGQERLGQLWHLYYYRNGVRLWAADLVERVWPGACPEAAAEARAGLRYSMAMRQEHGFAPRPEFQARNYAHLKAQGLTFTTFPFLENYHIAGYWQYLNHLLDWTDEHDVPLILVDMPVTADLEERLYPQAFATYRTTLAELERTRGVQILHAGREVVGLGDADFADLIHLNAQGTAHLSRWLRGQLALLGSTWAAAPRSAPRQLAYAQGANP